MKDSKNTISTIDDFISTFQNVTPDPSWNGILQTLWYDGKNDWNTAHEIAQDIRSTDGSLIHAYLHRKEGDNSNALYWYNRAGKKMPTCSLEEEWKELVGLYLRKVTAG